MGLRWDMLYAAMATVTSPAWAYRLWRTGRWRTDWGGRFGQCDPMPRDRRPVLLIHAVSVGEVNAIHRLVAMLNQQTKGSWRIVISATTDTGVARARQLYEPIHRVVRYPLDFSRPVRRFLDAVNPDLVALTELEVWPQFVQHCVGRKVPVCVINGRLSQRSFKRYRWVRSWLGPTFARLTLALVQTQQYAERFIEMGVPPDRVQVVDSMKWDGVTIIEPSSQSGSLSEDAIALAQAMGLDRTRPVIVAGSTGPGEERLFMDCCPPEAQLVLVPRRPERFDEVATLGPGMIRRSRHPDASQPPDPPARWFLIDTIGELNKVYTLADVAIVGRSFMGDLFGSNPLEPIALGKPTLIGPHYGDFTDIVEALRQGRGIEVTDRPGEAAARLLREPTAASQLAQRGQSVMLSHQGATDRHAQWLMRLMPWSSLNGHTRDSAPAIATEDE